MKKVYYISLVMFLSMASVFVQGGTTLMAQTYNVELSANPQSGGWVTGGGTGIPHGTTITVTATADSCYTFLNWMEDDAVLTTSPNYTFTVVKNRNLVANFVLKQCNITVLPNPTMGGVVHGSGSYLCGDLVTVCATPGPCYTFINWTTVGGNEISTSPCYTFVVTGDMVIVANFQMCQHNLNVVANPPEGGTVTGGGIVHCGDMVCVTATPNECYEFVNWTENGVPVCNDPIYTFSFYKHQDVTLVANFALKTYNITVITSPVHGGMVIGGGTYLCGDSVTICAYPSECFDFSHWRENDVPVSINPCHTFIVTSDMVITAVFEMHFHSLFVSANPPEGGTVAGGGTDIPCYETIPLTATPNECYEFLYWEENGVIVSTYSSFYFTLTEHRDYYFTAHFKYVCPCAPISDFPWTEGFENSGTELPDCWSQELDPQINCCWEWKVVSGATGTPPTAHSGDYKARINWDFLGLPVLKTKLITPAFDLTDLEDPVLDFWHAQQGLGLTVYYRNSKFGEWILLQSFIGESIPDWTLQTIPLPEQSSYYQIAFEGTFSSDLQLDDISITGISKCKVTILLNPPDGGTVTGEGTYHYGDVVTVSVTPEEGYEFANWLENGVEISTNDTYSFTVTKSRTLISNFEVYDIVVIPNLRGGGTVTGGGTFRPGIEITVSAVADEGYKFLNWTDESRLILSTDPDYTFITPMRNMKLTANFESLTGTEVDETAAIKIYPNPTTGAFRIENGAFKIENIEIFDVFGRVVEVAHSPLWGDFGGLYPSGIYFVRITTKDSVIVKKVVKQ